MNFKKNIIKTHSLEGTHGELRPKYTSVFTCTQGPRTVSVSKFHHLNSMHVLYAHNPIFVNVHTLCLNFYFSLSFIYVIYDWNIINV